jgi:uncharacterized protein (DUF427 family)
LSEHCEKLYKELIVILQIEQFCFSLFFIGDAMKAIWNKEVLADSDKTVVVEGNHYFPLSSLNMKFFKKSDKTTICSWKGTANYYDVKVNEQSNKDAAWYYPEPKSAAKNITGYVAFWRGVEVVDH